MGMLNNVKIKTARVIEDGPLSLF